MYKFILCNSKNECRKNYDIQYSRCSLINEKISKDKINIQKSRTVVKEKGWKNLQEVH